jgi:hypothetical protein
MNRKPYPEYKENGTKWRFDREEFDQWIKAHATGVSFATLNRWENGKIIPSKLTHWYFVRRKINWGSWFDGFQRGCMGQIPFYGGA